MAQERQLALFIDDQPQAKEELLRAPQGPPIPLEQGILVSPDTPWYERPVRGSRPEVVAWLGERTRLMRLREAIWGRLLVAEVYTVN